MNKNIPISMCVNNPTRDMIVDPMDPAAVANLAASMEQNGNWGGVVGRYNDDGKFEIACGHHRVAAAKKNGDSSLVAFVGDFDDSDMVRIYATENATQRGNGSTAVAGTVASAIKFLAYQIMTDAEVSTFFDTQQELAQARVAMSSEKGMGERVVTNFLKDIPGVNAGSVRQQLANLKSSGDYARIIAEVSKQVERENKEAMRLAAQAEKERVAAEKAEADAKAAREKAAAAFKAAKAEADKKRAAEAEKRAEADRKLAEQRRKVAEKESAKFDAVRTTVATAKAATESSAARDITFDFAGVAKHFKNENQVRAFRDIVTSVGVQPYLPVSNQASVAQSLVAEATRVAKEKGKGATPESVLSAQFIRDTIWGTLHGFKTTVKRAEKQTSKAEIERMGRNARMKDLQHQFARNVGTMDRLGVEISNLHRTWPKSETFPVGDEFRTAVSRLTSLAQLLKQSKIV